MNKEKRDKIKFAIKNFFIGFFEWAFIRHILDSLFDKRK